MKSRHWLAAGPVLVLLLVSGCGPADGLNRGGSLSGTVTIDGKPLGGGRVEIFSDNGRNSVSCQIRPDGGYTLVEPPLGPCKITVATSQLRGMPPVPKAPRGAPREGVSPGIILPKDVGLVYTPIPARYENLATTDVTVTVQRGNQTYDIKLTAKP